MGYRVLTVDGRDYDFIIGNDFLKIKTESNGSRVVKIHEFLGLTPEAHRELLSQRCGCITACWSVPGLDITPAKIADYIRREKL